MEDILLEMDRILRPEGAVIFRDNVDVLIKVNKVISGMRWNTKMTDHEDGPFVPEKILYAVKQYWVGGSDSAWRLIKETNIFMEFIGYFLKLILRRTFQAEKLQPN